MSQPFPNGSAGTRIALIAPTPAPYRAYEFDVLAQRLAGRLRFHLMFMERSFSEMAWADDVPKIATWEVLPPSPWRFLKRVPGLRRLNAGVAERLDAADPAALILNGYDTPTLWSAVAWARRRGRAVLFRSDSNGFDERTRSGLWRTVIKPPVVRAFFRDVDAFLSIGSANDDYFRLYGVPDERIFRAGFLVDGEGYYRLANAERSAGRPFRRELGIRQSRVLLFAGRFVPAKGIVDLVEAFRGVLRDFPDTALLLAGDGPLRREIEGRCAAIRDHVYFAGFLQPEQIGRAYGAADVFVLSSRHEPWGLVVNEAMAAGLPVVAAELVGAAADLVIPGRTGERFRGGSIDDLAAALRRVLAGDAAERMGTAARQQYLDWTTRHDAAAAHEAAIAYAIARARERVETP